MMTKHSREAQNADITWLEREYPNYSYLVGHRAVTTPKQKAYAYLGQGVDITEEITYSDLYDQVRRNAASLIAAGATGERVLLVMASDLDYTIAFLSCLSAGAIAITTIIPTTLSQVQRLEGIIEDARARFVIASQASHDRLRNRFGETRLFSDCQWLAYESLDEGSAETWTPPKADWDDVAFLQYTSGSTSAPKGVQVTHRNLARVGRYHERVFGVNSSDIGVTWLPQSHDMGLIQGVLQPLYTGYPTHIMTPLMFLKRPMNWLHAISTHRATTSIVPNFTYDACVKKAKPEDLARLDLSCLTSAANGAEPIRANTLEDFYQTFKGCGFKKSALKGAYGMAETSLAVSSTPRSESAVTKSINIDAFRQDDVLEDADPSRSQTVVSSGRTSGDVEVVIANVADGRDLGLMKVGEILVRGDIVTQGYWENPEATAEAFNVRLEDGRGPFLRTHDLGFLDENGDLFVTGRVKDVIIIHGKNYSPHDIEFSVEQLNPAVRQSYTTCFSVNANNQELVVVLAEIAKGSDIDDPDALARKIMQGVAREHQVPVLEVLIVSRGQCPKTTSGKIQRSKSRELYLGGKLSVVASHVHPMHARIHTDLRSCA